MGCIPSKPNIIDENNSLGENNTKWVGANGDGQLNPGGPSGHMYTYGGFGGGYHGGGGGGGGDGGGGGGGC